MNPETKVEIKEIGCVIFCDDLACRAMFTSDGPISAGTILPCGHKIDGVCFSAVSMKVAARLEE